MTFQQERFDDIYQELIPLLEDHYHEIAHYQDIPLAVNVEKYRKLDELGVLKLFTAKKDDGQLIGYAAFFAQYNNHYSTSFQAVQDVIYIDQGYRGQGFGAQFISYCDEALKEMGVQVVYQHVKVYHNFGPLLEALGYEHIEHIYGKRLDKWVPTP